MCAPPLLLFAMLLLAGQTTELVSQTPPTCMNTISAQCPADPNAVIETPQGFTIRANSTLMLSATPVSGADVRVFVNGVALIPEKEFHVEGTTLTFLRDVGSNGQDMIQIRYQSQFAPIHASGSKLSSKADLIARDALIKSFLLEEPSGPASTTSRDQFHRNDMSAPISIRHADFRSLHLLTESLDSRPDRQVLRKHEKSKPSTRAFDGIEGVGDSYHHPDYSSMLGIQETRNLGHIVNNRNRNVPGGLRSLQMLQQRLDQAGSRE